MSAGSQSFISNMIETAGGINVAAGTAERYYNYSLEQLLSDDPDVYLINSHSHPPRILKSGTATSLKRGQEQ
jgi:iron complex transport system substrate-binding protein